MDNKSYIPELYNLIKLGSTDIELANYLTTKGMQYGSNMIDNTFKKAGKENTVSKLLVDDDISLGDSVKSRMTSRVGTIFGIHSDGRTVEVKWESGGRQILSKESVFKLKGGDVSSKIDYDKSLNYKDITDHKKQK